MFRQTIIVFTLLMLVVSVLSSSLSVQAALFSGLAQLSVSSPDATFFSDLFGLGGGEAQGGFSWELFTGIVLAVLGLYIGIFHKKSAKQESKFRFRKLF